MSSLSLPLILLWKIDIYLSNRNYLSHKQLWFESWILDHLSIRDAGNSELWFWALHAKPPSEEVLHQVTIAESRPVPDAVLPWARVPPDQCIALPNLEESVWLMLEIWNASTKKVKIWKPCNVGHLTKLPKWVRLTWQSAKTHLLPWLQLDLAIGADLHQRLPNLQDDGPIAHLRVSKF